MDEMTTSFPIISNRYQIFSTIATGGMAVVYSAQDLLLERKVALKVLKKELSGDQTFQNKFRAEAKASAKLIHQNIVTIFDFGLDSERLYIVMEYVEGTDLKTIIQNAPNGLDLSLAIKYIHQAASGLAYAHNSGFVHCDVKPQNMLVSRNGILKITDFGIARVLDTISRNERYDVVWGSPFYFSPEQASGLPPSPASDIYSLGIIAFELITGKPPFISDDVSKLVEMHRFSSPPSILLFRSDVPKKLDDLVSKSLSKQAKDRFQTGTEFLNELKTMDQKIFAQSARAISQVAPSIRRVSSPPAQSAHFHNQKKNITKYNPSNQKLITIILSLIALVMVGGLIPFYLYVIFSINRLGK